MLTRVYGRKLVGARAGRLLADQSGNVGRFDCSEHRLQSLDPLRMARSGIVFEAGGMGDQSDGHGAQFNEVGNCNPALPICACPCSPQGILWRKDEKERSDAMYIGGSGACNDR